ncbi:MAG TPA: hypothetical protein VGP31_09105 [Planosporangium sp.]|nr:hypothetical protein [Planosporangium sp.]
MKHTGADGATRTAGRAVGPAIAGPVVGLDLDHDTVEAAEHWLHDLVNRLGHPAGLVACTHLVYEPHPHVAVSLSSPVGEEGAPLTAHTGTGAPSCKRRDEDHPGAKIAAAEHEARSAGRAVYYPGVELLTGTLTVGEVIERSAIERVVLLGGAEATPETVLHTLDYVRPVWTDGQLALVTRPAPEGCLAPFELKHSTPCCADH